MGLAVVRDLREVRAPACAEEIERFETDVVAGFVLARAAAGLSDGTIRGDVSHRAGAELVWSAVVGHGAWGC
ncbi:MAG TPA: hypothetical protein VIY28_15850 [Pseudonocardiaceae bacterium]